MKKILTAFVMMAMMAIMIPLMSTETNAQTRRYYRNRTTTTTVYNRPSFYRRHRNVINMGIGTAAGAILGGIIGGKKGALIGAGTGLGGSALYTYKIRPKQRRYYYYR
ncbi:MAG TPA: YMGG-like glycine zipper-containing protein [Pyrinomonadaceae bacterium]|jgi:outer membrane lipoprotein SlyB